MRQNIRSNFAQTGLLLLFFLLGCYTSGDSASTAGGPLQNGIPETTHDDGVDSSSKFFYFSYDDSASTAAVELVKFRLNHGTLPPASLARPWEFFNYESFDPANPETAGVFSVSMGVMRRPIPDTGDSEYHLGVYVAAPEITTTERQNAVLTLVLDVSGSMDWMSTSEPEIGVRKLDIAKYGLTQLAASLKEGDVVNLVTFSNEAYLVLNNVLYSQVTTSFLPAVEKLELIGGTNLAAGLQKGYEVALSTFDPAKMNRVVMITDAYANIGEIDSTVIAQNTAINEAEGIFFSGIGVGSDFNEAFLDDLTEAGRGAYFTVITNQDAKRAFQDRFIALISVAARHVRFKLDFPENLVHTTSAAEETSTVAQDVKETNFSYNTSQYFYEVFSGPSGTTPTRYFTLTITYTDTATNTETTQTLTKSIDELIGLQENNIRDAETIFLFTELLGGRKTASEINMVLQDNYTGYSSPLFLDYTDLMDKHRNLTGQKPAL